MCSADSRKEIISLPLLFAVQNNRNQTIPTPEFHHKKFLFNHRYMFVRHTVFIWNSLKTHIKISFLCFLRHKSNNNNIFMLLLIFFPTRYTDIHTQHTTNAHATNEWKMKVDILTILALAEELSTALTWRCLSAWPTRWNKTRTMATLFITSSSWIDRFLFITQILRHISLVLISKDSDSLSFISNVV